MNKNSILVVAAHPDDEVLGCGGTMAAHAAHGDDVHIAILAQGLSSRGETCQADFDDLRAAAARAKSILSASSLTMFDFPDNRMDTVALLEVVKVVEGLIDRYRPAVVYTHFASDLNVDHRRTHEAVVTACRPLPDHPVGRVLCFEVPSSTEWQPAGSAGTFAPNWFIDIGSTLDKKLAALVPYAAEMRPYPHPRSLEAIRHLAAWRGAAAGFMAAEAFVLARQRGSI